MIFALTVLCWILYSSLFGYCDAWYWYSANVGKYSIKDFKFKDLHPHYFVMRSIVGSLFSLLIFQNNFFEWLGGVICLGMVFPFFHNGFYYLTRNKIDPTKYPKGFYDMSSTSISKINFTFIARLILAILGLLGIGLIYFL